MSGLIEDNRDSHICFWFSLLSYGWYIWRNIWPHMKYDWKKEKYFNRCSFLILHQNLTNGSILIVQMWNLKPCQYTFLLCFIKICLVCTLNGSFTHAWFCSIISWSFGKYWFTDMHIVQMLTHFIIQDKQITFVNNTTKFIRKVFNYWEAVTSTGWT